MIKRTKKLRSLHRIKSLLYLKKIKPAVIAELAGVSVITVRTVLNGHGKSKKVQQVVADLLNMPYERIWGVANYHRGIIANGKRVVND